MRSILTKLRVLFPPQEQRHALLLAPAILLMAILQVAGIGSLMPFLAVVADPAIIGRNKPLGWLYQAFGFEATAPFLVMLGAGMFVVLLIGNVATALITWWMVRFAEMRTHYLATSLLERHLAASGYAVVQTTSPLIARSSVWQGLT